MQARRLWAPLPVLLLGFLLACAQRCPASAAQKEPQLYTYEVVAEYPHDANAFTQGLEFDDVCDDDGENCRDIFWESTGLNGRSSVRQVHLESGAVEASTALEQQWFGEGLARLGGKLYQLTWQTPTGFVYDAESLARVGEFTTPLSDGWGLAADGQLLVVSDGSASLTWVDPAAGFKAARSVIVKDGERAIHYLNELEVIDGEVWANVWQTDCIARVDPATGAVRAWVLLHGLRSALAARNLGGAGRHHLDVLNGIAWDAARKRLFVTGKLWPRVFEVVPLPLDANAEGAQAKRRSCYVGDGGGG